MKNKIVKSTKKQNKQIEKVVKKIEDNYEVVIAAAIAILGVEFSKHSDSKGKLDKKVMNQYTDNKMDMLIKKIAKEVTDLYSENDKETRAVLRKVTESAGRDVRKFINFEIDKDIITIPKSIDITKTVNERMAGLNWARRNKHHRDNVIYEVEKVLRNGLDSGKTYGDMAKELESAINVRRSHAKTIVRTEGHRAINTARQESFEEMVGAGVKAEKVWITARDERVRSYAAGDQADHEAMDGVTVPIGEDFETPAGSTGKGPGMMVGPAADNINCRCDFYPRILEIN